MTIIISATVNTLFEEISKEVKDVKGQHGRIYRQTRQRSEKM